METPPGNVENTSSSSADQNDSLPNFKEEGEKMEVENKEKEDIITKLEDIIDVKSESVTCSSESDSQQDSEYMIIDGEVEGANEGPDIWERADLTCDFKSDDGVSKKENSSDCVVKDGQGMKCTPSKDTNASQIKDDAKGSKSQNKMDQSDEVTQDQCILPQKDHVKENETVTSVAEASGCATRVVDRVSSASSSASSSAGKEDKKKDSMYYVKWIPTNGSDEQPIVTQNENGPCPLIAIVNVLLLKKKVTIPPGTELIASEKLMTFVGDSILKSAKTTEMPEPERLNYEQNMNDAMCVIPNLQTGLDVNVRFTGVSQFEYTPECIIFDLLGIPLCHGWLVDPQDAELVSIIGNKSYNQLVESIVSQSSSSDPNVANQGALAKMFLDKSASQLTYHGLCELNSFVKEDQLCVFFRNNHFSTMLRHKDEMFLLVTDQGFLNEKRIVWETLSNVEGDGYFVDTNFHTYQKPSTPCIEPPELAANTDEQMDRDYLLAMSLQQEQMAGAAASTDEQPNWVQEPMTDQELAAKLQAEEDQRAALHYQQQQQQQHQQQLQQRESLPRGQGAGQGRQSRERERDSRREREPRDKSKDCCIL